MNRKRRMIMVSVIGMLTLLATTCWSVLAGEFWPPLPYQACSLAGAWTETNSLSPGSYIIVTNSPEDPTTGRGFMVSTMANPDLSMHGVFPDATSCKPWMGNYVRTGPNTWQFRLVMYVMKDVQPQPVVLSIVVSEGTITMTAPDTTELVETLSLYLPSQDKDLDGLPDAGEQPLTSVPATAQQKAL